MMRSLTHMFEDLLRGPGISAPRRLVSWARGRHARSVSGDDSLIQLTCPTCRKLILVDAHFAGRKGKCRGCGTILSIAPGSCESSSVPANLDSPDISTPIASGMLLLDPQVNRSLKAAAIVLGLVLAVVVLGLFVYGASEALNLHWNPHYEVVPATRG